MAKYKGNSQKDAKKVLDSSQNGKSHPRGASGHPRGHASDPDAKGDKDSVENYSKYSKKTGFLSKSDQDLVTHLALKTIEARELMELMNELGEKISRESLHISPSRLEILEDEMPKAQWWHNGKKVGKPEEIREITLVLKHRYEEYDDEDADIFILTEYPKV
ncbi:hypothetical protein QAD02_015946 [Eretmocerus hayati]|uniref:Uncharacterized protein n=1 Tax=Eretmocerus hayati TaxID=131215 RepID=A0ACC2PA30_9HYME|nr:hypothetical protein QAD02_015946 [Eretmocerus hayati]